ncbi:hypothetical protein DFH11DRAFT_1626642, partial [Phellopilus nigrolimitatus]
TYICRSSGVCMTCGQLAFYFPWLLSHPWFALSRPHGRHDFQITVGTATALPRGAKRKLRIQTLLCQSMRCGQCFRKAPAV